MAQADRGRRSVPFWAGCDGILATGSQLTAEYQRNTARPTEIRMTMLLSAPSGVTAAG